MKKREFDMQTDLIQLDDLILDVANRRVTREGQTITIAVRSYELLRVLLERWPATVAKHDLIEAAWDGAVVSEETLRQRVRLLRQSLGGAVYVQSVKGVGYRLGVAPIACPRATEVGLRWFVSWPTVTAASVLVASALWVTFPELVHSVLHALRH